MKPTSPKYKNCKVCEKRFQIFSTTTQVCSPTCALEFAREKARIKEQKAKKASAKKDRKDLRDFNRKDLWWQHKLTQKAFNRMRVLEELKWFKDRGLTPTCISCDKPNMDWCCGHYKTVGAHPELRYSRLNTMLQCNRYCNMALSGNISGNKTTRGYTQGVIDRLGKESTECRDFILGSESQKITKYTWQRLEEMRKEFNQRIKELSE